MKRVVLLLAILAVNLVNTGLAQYTPLLDGYFQEPPGTRRMQIRNQYATIIFPESASGEANHILNLVNTLTPLLSQTSANIPKQRIVLRNRLSESNGFSTLVPRKVEFFLSPPQYNFGGAGRWSDLLTIHELRHSAQFGWMNRGFNKIAGWIGGNEGLSLMMNFSTPNWFFEGDAVWAETVLSHAGRGREPAFEAPLRSMMLAGRVPSYNQWIFGSYRNWIPYDSDYSFGYLFVSYMNRTYGQDVWDMIIERTARFSFIPYRFESAVKKSTGKSVRKNYYSLVSALNKIWHEQYLSGSYTHSDVLFDDRPGVHTFRLYPEFADSTHILYLRWGHDDMFSFVLYNTSDHSEKILYSSAGIAWRNGFSFCGGSILWTEYIPDLRWGARSYSDIFELNIKSGVKKRITHKGRYFSPALSPAKDRIAAVETTPAGTSHIVLLNPTDGKVVLAFVVPGYQEVQSPSWSEDGRYICYTGIDEKGKSLVSLDIKNGTRKILIPPSFNNISFPVFSGDNILFNATYSGLESIYSLNPDETTITRVCERPFGASSPNPGPDGKLVFSEVTPGGSVISVLKKSDFDNSPLEKIRTKQFEMFVSANDSISGEETSAILTDSIYPARPYRQLLHALNIHSWGLNGGGIDKNTGAYIKSANVLNTFGCSINATFNRNEKTMMYGGSLVYAGWYPVFDLEFSTGKRTNRFLTNHDQEVFESWGEKSVKAGIRLPFDLSRGKYRTGVLLSSGSSYTRIHDKEITDDPWENSNGDFMPFTASLSFNRTTSWIRDIAPRWGQILRITHRSTPFGGDYSGRIFSIRGRFYFPSIFKQHSIFADLASENIHVENYAFSSEIVFPRGYEPVTFPEFFKAGINYAFPLICPDRSLAGLFYLKRITADLFYDHGIGHHAGKDYVYRSAGVEITSETFLFRINYPFFIGIRYSSLFDQHDNAPKGSFEVILNTGL